MPSAAGQPKPFLLEPQELKMTTAALIRITIKNIFFILECLNIKIYFAGNYNTVEIRIFDNCQINFNEMPSCFLQFQPDKGKIFINKTH
jgi:hypothetical protein